MERIFSVNKQGIYQQPTKTCQVKNMLYSSLFLSRILKVTRVQKGLGQCHVKASRVPILSAWLMTIIAPYRYNMQKACEK